MIRVMDSGREPMRRDFEKCLDPQLWHACAGPLVQMPSINSKVIYFPQGHVEHAQGNVDFGNSRIPSHVLCRVSAIKFMADPETDEVYAKMGLTPLRDNSNFDVEDEGYLGNNGIENSEKPKSFAKTLTQSDANNGGGFSVPRYCAETIFPPLDFSAVPPVQNILAKDVHGETWRFRHIYRGTPRRHLLTTGWSNFVNQKKLVAGDSIVFLRADNGDLCVGIRRAKKGIGCGHEYPYAWNPLAGNYGSQYENSRVVPKPGMRDARGKVKVESVVEAATLAARGQPFEVVYYPRASTPEFCVRAPAVTAAMQIRWCSGMRFKMPFETEDSSRISWFMGTISNAQIEDPIRWPDSPWRLLQVTWDEPDLLQNVKCVNPWLVELVSSMPMHVSPFSPPRKKMRLPQNPDFALVSHPMPLLPTNFLNSPFHCIQDNIPAGIQGARHAQFGPYPVDLHRNELQPGMLPLGLRKLDISDPLKNPSGGFMKNTENSENISCWLKMGHPNQSLKANEETKTPQLLLFGQVILTEEQLSKSSSGENSSSEGNLDKTANHSDNGSGSTVNSSDGRSPWYKFHHDGRSDQLHGQETGHCKVFIESDDVGRTLDLSLLGSYQELYRKLGDMFGIEQVSGLFKNLLYLDATGSVKQTGEEPFRYYLIHNLLVYDLLSDLHY
ncbi:auxin response factor 16 isoform X1 [Cannabis sativa]|uniref:auxin response factor 16 isoform X1 n=1 Tax=Cannabis sativa TaxID=3483 RepID=UPI0029CA819A|nr:auxin response factor 16 isoform X1 [Cannabis sativa]